MAAERVRRPPIEPAYVWNGAPGLDGFHVFALIVNKMIGTGVYTSPAAVYLFTGNKSLALALWAIGFVYSILSMWMYLDYTAALPFTGGELVYMSEMTAYSGRPEALYGEGVPPRHKLSMFRRLGRRVFADGMLAYVTYSVLFALLFNSVTNSMQFGRMVLIFAGEADPKDGQSTPEVNPKVIRLIGAFALTLLCLFQLFFPRGGRALNKCLALLKIICVLGMIISGADAAARRRRESLDSEDNWSAVHKDLTAAGFSKALIAVLFSFQGWENATFVAGEIAYTKHKTMRRAFMGAVVTVGILYLVAAGVFLDAISWDRLSESKTTFYAPLYFDYSIPSQIAWAVVVAISALGNLNSIIYTNSRVKQAIGQANVLPWSKIWALDWNSMMRNGRGDGPDVDNIGNHSPMGGLLLHWLVSVILLACTAAIKDTSESISMPGYLQTYCHAFIQFLLSLLFARLHIRKQALDLGRYTNTNFRLYLAEKAWLCLPAIVILSGFSMFLVVATGLGPYIGVFGKLESFQGYYYPTILFSVVAGALLYYLFVFGIAERRYLTPRTTDLGPGEQGPKSALWDEPGPLTRTPFDKWNILKKIFHVQPVFWVDEWYADGGYNGPQQTVLVERVRRFGRRWRVTYVDDDYMLSNDAGRQADQPIHFFYWFFGGRSAFPRNPYLPMRTRIWNRISARWVPSRQWFSRRGEGEDNYHQPVVVYPVTNGGVIATERVVPPSHEALPSPARTGLTSTTLSIHENRGNRPEPQGLPQMRSTVSTPSSEAAEDASRRAARGESFGWEDIELRGMNARRRPSG